MAVLCLVLFCLALWGCDADDWGADELALGTGSNESKLLAQGKHVYDTYCFGCHGEKGDGNGEAARFFQLKPRDFTLGRLKFAAVSSGESPRDEDYLRVIDHGLDGTAMPSFRLLPLNEKQAVIAYIKSFYSDWDDDPPGGEITVGQDPWVGDEAEAIEEGNRLYHGLATCWSCHPAYATRQEIGAMFEELGRGEPSLREDLFQTTIKESDWGAPLKAPDFLIDLIRTGIEIDNLARVVASGVGGTAMPTWDGALEPEQIWGIAYYVNSLAREQGTAGGDALKRRLLEEDPEDPPETSSDESPSENPTTGGR
jgi:mono/diheme cytochrome c family protein